ncbi:MAG: DUF4870 domain-containing protein [bacterium]
MFTHLAGLIWLFGIPFGQIFGPLVIWLLKKEDYQYVNAQGKEALNFQISCTVYAILCAPLILVGIGILLLIAVGVFNVIFTIAASVKAGDGILYRYPLTFRAVK